MRRIDQRPGQSRLVRRRHGCPIRWQGELAVIVALLVPTALAAQVLPAEPIALAGGRLVVSGEVSGTVAPEDTGYFNYTDYEQSALRLVRAGLTTSLSLGRKAMVLGEVRSETGNAFDVYAMFLRLRPWDGRAVDVQLGRIPPTFGAFSRRGYGIDNPLIGYPLPYHYLTSLRADALPATADDLLRMRGRGWRPVFPIGDQTAQPGLPLMSALRWDTGVQVRVGGRPVQFVAAVTNGSLSNPLVKDDNGGKQVASRVAYQPSPGLVFGVSVGRAAYLSRIATDLVAVGSDDSFTQEAVGVDLEYSREHWLVRAEGVFSRWTVPTVNVPFIDSPLGAAGLFVEGQYKLQPGFYIAGRVDYLGFSSITGTLDGGRPTPWDFPVTRLEVGGGYYVLRNMVAKVAYQQNWRENPLERRTRFVAAQMIYWF